MAYITTEKVKEMRDRLKDLFPAKKGWKLSVTKENYSSVNCSILTAPFELRRDITRNDESVNQYFVKDHYNDNPATKEVLLTMLQVLNTDNYDRSDSQSDYFDVGHYVSLSIGKWDKPFQQATLEVENEDRYGTPDYIEDFDPITSSPIQGDEA